MAGVVFSEKLKAMVNDVWGGANGAGALSYHELSKKYAAPFVDVQERTRVALALALLCNPDQDSVDDLMGLFRLDSIDALYGVITSTAWAEAHKCLRMAQGIEGLVPEVKTVRRFHFDLPAAVQITDESICELFIDGKAVAGYPAKSVVREDEVDEAPPQATCGACGYRLRCVCGAPVVPQTEAPPNPVSVEGAHCMEGFRGLHCALPAEHDGQHFWMQSIPTDKDRSFAAFNKARERIRELEARLESMSRAKSDLEARLEREYAAQDTCAVCPKHGPTFSHTDGDGFRYCSAASCGWDNGRGAAAGWVAEVNELKRSIAEKDGLIEELRARYDEVQVDAGHLVHEKDARISELEARLDSASVEKLQLRADLERDGVETRQLRVLLREKQEAAEKDLRYALNAKDAAYAERNRIVALLAAIYPSALGRHPDEDTSWEDDWRWIVFIELPSGQVSWHIHDSELGFFEHVSREGAPAWDGHTTKEKYERVMEAARIRAKEREGIAGLKGMLKADKHLTIEDLEPMSTEMLAKVWDEATEYIAGTCGFGGASSTAMLARFVKSKNPYRKRAS